MIKIVVKGLNQIRSRMQQFPQQYDNIIHKALQDSLLAIWENVLPYPPPPEGSTYKRTGTLGRSMGVSMGGGKSGTPDIYEVSMGSGRDEAKFGSNLNYAPRVIGDDTQEEPFVTYWWTVRDVANKAKGKIIEVFQNAADSMARWLDGGL